MVFGSSSFDPGEDPTTDVATDKIAGVEYQIIKTADPLENSTTPIGTPENPHRATLEHSKPPPNSRAIPVVAKTADAVSLEGLVTVNAISAIVIPANGSRIRAWVRSKRSNTKEIFVSLSDVASPAKPSELNPGEPLSIEGYTGPISAVTADGTAVLEVVEI